MIKEPTTAVYERALAQGVRKKLLDSLRWPSGHVVYEAFGFAAVTDTTKQTGILVMSGRVVAYTLNRRRAARGGKVEPIVCDLCSTWRRGSESAILTLSVNRHSTRSHLVCSDLGCCDHVLGDTAAAILSKTQLRETTTREKRIARLEEHMMRVFSLEA